MATTMKAVQYEAGEADKMTVKTVPVPQLRTNEVLVKVYKTAINRADIIQVHCCISSFWGLLDHFIYIDFTATCNSPTLFYV